MTSTQTDPVGLETFPYENTSFQIPLTSSQDTWDVLLWNNFIVLKYENQHFYIGIKKTRHLSCIK